MPSLIDNLLRPDSRLRNLIGLSENGESFQGVQSVLTHETTQSFENPSLALLKFKMMTGNQVNHRQPTLRLGSGDHDVASEPIRSICVIFLQVSRWPLSTQSPE